MPFAPAIRKDILKVLDKHIIPALEGREVVQLLAEPPFDFSAVEHWTLQRKMLPDKELGPLQLEHQWMEEGVMTVAMPNIMFAYEGVCYERVGITEKLAGQTKAAGHEAPGGVIVLRMPAPAMLSHPAQTMRSLGVPRTESLADHGSALLYRLSPEGIQVSLNTRGPLKEFASHSLEINDPTLAQLGNLYLDELRQPGGEPAAKALQLALMYRLKRYLLQYKPAVSNTSWVVPEENPSSKRPELTAKNREIYVESLKYILEHLHLPLTLDDLADRAGVSNVQLNTIYKQTQGITLMRYITQLRVEAAKQIILTSNERIADVARLVGFAGGASFSIVFRKHTGYSPHYYRKKYAKETKPTI